MKLVDLVDTVRRTVRMKTDEDLSDSDHLRAEKERQANQFSSCLSSHHDGLLRLVWIEIRRWWSM